MRDLDLPSALTIAVAIAGLCLLSIALLDWLSYSAFAFVSGWPWTSPI